ILGGGFLTALPEIQRELGVQAGWLRPAINGLLLLLVIIFLPSGLVGVGRRIVPAQLRARLDASSAPLTESLTAAPPAGETPPVAVDAPAVARMDGVTKEYGGVHALKSVSLTVRE